MKQIGIITHYDVHNHGALLQLNALVRILSSKFNAEAFALQFDKNYDFLGIEMRNKYNISLKSMPIYLKYLFKKGLGQTFFNIKKRRVLEDFKKHNKLVGEFYSEYSDLASVIIGSDEVFALHTGPTPVFWGYCLPSSNVISYAGSFGPTDYEDIEKKHCLSFVSGGISSLKSISVRDKNSADIIERVTGKRPQIVCDPVILYGYEDEIKNMPKVDLPPYVLIYSYDKNMNESHEVKMIKQFAKEHNLLIVSPGFYHSWCDKNLNADPVELLRYFRDAEFVITDTFHGTVMSLITNKDMAVIPRGNRNKLLNLLEEYNLSDRIVCDKTLNGLFTDKIPWSNVNCEINRRRELAMNYLFDSVK